MTQGRVWSGRLPPDCMRTQKGVCQPGRGPCQERPADPDPDFHTRPLPHTELRFGGTWGGEASRESGFPVPVQKHRGSEISGCHERDQRGPRKEGTGWQTGAPGPYIAGR